MFRKRLGGEPVLAPRPAKGAEHPGEPLTELGDGDTVPG